MENSTYIREAIEIVRFGLETARSVDGFIIKLESAIAHILEYGNEEDIKLFFSILVKEGLLNRLACNRDDLETILSSPRHTLMRRYSDMLYDALDRSTCTDGFKYVIPQPSRAAGQISWGSEYRDLSFTKRHLIIYRKILDKCGLRNILVAITILIILLLILYSAYQASLHLVISSISTIIPIRIINEGEMRLDRNQG